MPASFYTSDKILSPAEFSEHTNVNEHFEGLKNAQHFIRSWVNDKQFFDQKTSGSTGKPTVHTISRKNMLASASRTAQVLNLNTGLQALVCINMSYIGGKMMLARGMQFDWHLHLVAPVSFASSVQIPSGSFDFAAMVPLQIENLLQSEAGLQLLNNTEKIIVGGAAVSKELIRQIQPLKCRVYATYGMTETISHIALQKLNGPDRADHFSMLPGVDFGLDERGCLRLKADVTDNQWIQTNDLTDLKDNGSFKITGRADNIINTGGVKVSAEMLEEKIAPLLKGQAKDYAISSIPDALLGNKIVLICEGLTIPPEDLKALLKSSLGKFEVPKEIISQQIPKTASGKIDRARLKRVVHSTQIK
ncbi:MAG: AMP-binding protein [Roseivirga sp.]|nr:AMP-binding protein [Roseivirga sp.]